MLFKNLFKVELFKNIILNKNFSFFLFIFVSVAFFIIGFVNIDNPFNAILGGHDFRRTQTALTAFYLVKNGFSFAYETPVIGFPWSWPMEFPLYQWITGIISSTFNFPLVATGRTVSLCFAYLTIIPIYNCLKILGMEKKHFFYLVSIFLSAPIYIFWSSTFMIESTALFFTFCFIYYVIKVFQGYTSTKLFLIGSFFLVLALLQKATTVLPVLVIACIFYTFNYDIIKLKKNPVLILKFFIFLIVPVLILLYWTNFADSIKELNPIGTHLTSEALKNWNWGDLKSRISPVLWIDVVLNRTIKDNFLSFISLAIIIASFFIPNNKYKIYTFYCLLIFLSYFLMFPILHRVHNYYQYSNYVFYIIAFGISSLGILSFIVKKFNNKKLIYIEPVFFMIVILISFVQFFSNGYGKEKFKKITMDNNRVIPITSYLKKITSPDEALIVYGHDYSSVIAFHSERKSLTLPFNKWDIEAITNTEKFLPSIKVGAILNCYDINDDSRKKVDELIHIKYQIKPVLLKGCRIYDLK